MSQNNLHAAPSEMEESHHLNVTEFSLKCSLESHEKEECRTRKTRLLHYQTELHRSNEAWKEIHSLLKIKEQKLSDTCVMNSKAFEGLESVICSLKCKLSKAGEENVRLTRKLEENEFEFENMISEVAQLECLKNQNQTEINSLRATVDDLKLHVVEVQQDKDEKVAQFKHLDERMNTRVKNLSATLEDYDQRETSLIKHNKFITDKLALLEYQTDSKQAKNDNLQVEVENLQENEKILMKKNQSLIAELARFESLANETILTKEQSLIAANEIAQLKFLTAKQNDENKKLKTTVQELLNQVEENEQQIWNNNEIITEQTRENGYKTEEIEKLYNIRSDLQQSIDDLNDQLQMRQEEQILNNLREECRIVAENTDLPENQRDESLLENIPEDQTDERTPEESLLTVLAAVVQTRPLWFSCVKALLKVGLPVGVGIVGTLLTMRISAMSADCPGKSNCCLLEFACHLQQHLFGFHYITPPPF